jgi:hypothetical protein
MKVALTVLLFIGLISGAYFKAQSKLQTSDAYRGLKLGMTTESLETILGLPTSQDRNLLTYIFDDSSELTITLRDDIVSSAKIRFRSPIKIEDPDFRKLTLVQMESDTLTEKPSWFFAGKPAEGLVYKITSDGFIESLTWVPPFTYGSKDPKNLQALLKDFKTQQTINM